MFLYLTMPANVLLKPEHFESKQFLRNVCFTEEAQ